MYYLHGDAYFLVPKNFDKNDMDFDVFNARGDHVGTVIQGLSPAYFPPSLKQLLENELSDIACSLEAELKFQREFGIETKGAKETGLLATEIFDRMESNWAISPEVMDEVLGSNLQ